LEIALKVDVDTHQGLAQGVPRLARLLVDENVTATFFIAMGPDNSGRAALRALRNPGFIAKMRRTRAVSIYGLRTILSGTVLPARPISLALPEVVRDLDRMGFELGVHGYDHVRWQDHLDEVGDSGLGAEIADAFEAFRAITGHPARCFAAPGWRTNGAALCALDRMGLDYRSDTRGHAPYRCAMDGETFAIAEIPTTLPTMDEILGTPQASDAASCVRLYLDLIQPGALNVHTIHAEIEGMGQLDAFKALMRALKQRDARFVQLREVAARLAHSELPVCQVLRTTISGRAGWVSTQGTVP
jgi:peptidoglycan/xylan/chitin deacetylase (PgdA/CDA1 family)